MRASLPASGARAQCGCRCLRADCGAGDSILERGFDKAFILTDGYASLDEDKQAELKKFKLQALTILFGGKTDCSEFAPFGDVVQLDDITD